MFTPHDELLATCQTDAVLGTCPYFRDRALIRLESRLRNLGHMNEVSLWVESCTISLRQKTSVLGRSNDKKLISFAWITIGICFNHFDFYYIIIFIFVAKR